MFSRVPQRASLARRGTLQTTEHIHLLEPALEGQIHRLHRAAVLTKSGAFFTLGPETSGFKKGRGEKTSGTLGIFANLSYQSMIFCSVQT